MPKITVSMQALKVAMIAMGKTSINIRNIRPTAFALRLIASAIHAHSEQQLTRKAREWL